MTIKQFWIIGIFYLVATKCDGQKTNITQVLSAVLKDEKIDIIEQSNLRLGLMTYDLPFLEKIDIRTETNRLLTTRQEFMIRTSFNNFGQRKAERNKFGALLTKKNARTSLAKNEILSTRYADIVDYIFLHLKQITFNKSKNHLLDKLKISETMLSSGLSIDLEDYIKIKESMLEHELKEKSLEADIKSLAKRMMIDVEKELDLSYLPLPEQAKEIITGLNPDFNDHPTIRSYDLETQLLNANLNVLRSENAKILDFAQAKYTVREDLLLENRFSIGLGLTIPWNGSFTLKQQDIQVKKDDISTDKEIKKAQLKTDFERSKIEFDQEFQKYQLWKNFKTDTILASLKLKVINSGRLNPLKVLSLNDNEVEAESKLLEQYELLMKLYIKIMKTSGQLFSTPYRNYLHFLLPELID